MDTGKSSWRSLAGREVAACGWPVMSIQFKVRNWWDCTFTFHTLPGVQADKYTCVFVCVKLVLTVVAIKMPVHTMTLEGADN